MISQDHLIERSCEYMGGNSSRNGTILISLVTIDSDSGDIIFLIRYVTTRDHMFKGLCELLMEAPNMTNVAIGLVQVKI